MPLSPAPWPWSPHSDMANWRCRAMPRRVRVVPASALRGFELPRGAGLAWPWLHRVTPWLPFCKYLKIFSVNTCAMSKKFYRCSCNLWNLVVRASVWHYLSDLSVCLGLSFVYLTGVYLSWRIIVNHSVYSASVRARSDVARAILELAAWESRKVLTLPPDLSQGKAQTPSGFGARLPWYSLPCNAIDGTITMITHCLLQVCYICCSIST